MDRSSSELDVFNELAHDFAERYRRGDRPSLKEYADRHPELAEEIRELFPALVMMEKIGSRADQPSNPVAERPRSDGPMPDRLGDYLILRELGRGGMGIVYEAVQESLGRHVALKVLSHNRQMGPVQLIRFRREARAAALLHHTNIVPIFFVGEHDGIHYYVMQYIRGQGLDVVLREVVRARRDGNRSKVPHDEVEAVSVTLAARLLMMRGSSATTARARPSTVVRSSTDRPGESQAAVPESPRDEGPPPGWPSSPSSDPGRARIEYYRSVARLGVQVAEALAHAHLHGVLHRDIKPANLLLDLEGTIWVTDFGLAKSEGSEELTNPGDIVGTLRYMAPERFQGKADPRSDVYSLGLTLYEMLTLTPAFTASHRVQLIHVILHDEPERPRKHDPRLPRDLETIVLKAIAKNPSDRFATAREMASELGRFCEGRPIRSRRLSTAERLWRWSRRNPALARLTALATALTAILLVGSAATAWKFREQRDVVRLAQRDTEASLGRALTAEREGRAELGRSLLRRARAVRYSGRAGRRFEALQTLAEAAQIAREEEASPGYAAELRDEVIAALALADDRPVQSWPGVNWSSTQATSSIDADRYVELGDKGSIHVYRLSDRAEVLVLGADRPSARSWPIFVPGGRFLTVLSGRRQTEMWDLERGEMPAAWPADALGTMPRGDGRQIAVLRSDGAVHVYDLPSMTEAARCRVPFDRPIRYLANWLSLSEDGRYLAFMQDVPKTALVYELATGRIVREVAFPTARVHRSLALGRTGGLLAISHDRAISVYDVTTGEQLAMLGGHQSEGITAQFQPGGGLLASSGWDGTTRLWDPVRGQLLVTLQGYLRNWNGGGSRLEIAREPDLIQYQIEAADERRTIDCRLLGDSAGATLFGPARLAYSPDGRLIAMAMRPDGVRIVRASDGVGLAHLPIGDCDEVLFLPDGALLTSNARGLCRWPVRQPPGGPLKMGPPEPLALLDQPAGLVNAGLASSRSGRLVGALFPTHPGPMLIDPERAWRRTWSQPHDKPTGLAISPDGRWVATAGRGKSPIRQLVKVCDVATGKVLVELPAASIPLVFSPDGRWLGVGVEGGYRLFRTGSWTPGPEIDRGGGQGATTPLAFHPGSRVAAVLDAKSSRLQLVDVETGGVLATLEAPDATWTTSLVFSPDGRHLAAAQSDQRVNVWDLSAIRRRLEALHLATGFPDIFGGGEGSVEAPALDRIEVEGAGPVGLKLLMVRQALQEAWFDVRRLLDPELDDAEELSMRGERWSRLGRWRPAVADYRASLARRPDSSRAANNLAWELASAPGRGDAEEALRMARKAVAMEPNAPHCRNTLGVALYRTGHLAEAAAVLKSNAPRNASPGYDWIFLAICHHRLDQTAQARTALENALRWRAAATRLTPAEIAEFRAIFQEAESVMNGAFPDLPADVFAPGT
jgi:eukaryotic-like serine/threonine-protein kinase